jgi:SAM-dependent methyltransferase
MMPYTIRGIKFELAAMFSNGNQMVDKEPPAPNQLAAFFESHKEGPGICKWRHYFDIYHRHFSRFVGREVHVLEVGIYSGGSLLMWKEYFGENAKIYGVDINESCRAYEDDRTKVFIGDQADRSFWAEVKKTAPLIDIVIDDGGHLPEQQLVTLEEMLPHIRPGGVYLSEDIWQKFNAFAAYVQGLSDKLNEFCALDVESPVDAMHSAPSTFQAAINSIHVYPFVTIIEKYKQPVHDFVAPMQGSQWQPWNAKPRR